MKINERNLGKGKIKTRSGTFCVSPLADKKKNFLHAYKILFLYMVYRDFSRNFLKGEGGGAVKLGLG